jgi:HAD superfamily hydrolase (TIGR01509 family)
MLTSGADAPDGPVLVFDLDGTLVDSVYQHVTAWQRAFADVGVHVSLWRIHRRIGMGGDLLVRAVLREANLTLPKDVIAEAKSRHTEHYANSLPSIHPLPGAAALLDALDERAIRWAIATSGQPSEAQPVLKLLGREVDHMTVIDGGDVSQTKPDPHLFMAAIAKLNADPRDALILGDSAWDMLGARRARALGIGLLSGGNSRGELEAAQALLVYQDPQDVLDNLGELGLPE